MKIDRHNYEEFFLLYVDNELSAEQKKSVDQFIEENADLAKELEILQQLTLKADNEIVFEGKELLFKKENDSFITMMNYEEYLVAYIDNELNADERKEFEKFAALHPAVKEELGIFLQTKLHPEEEIVFEGKELLFKNESDSLITMMNYEEYLVAYIDNELNADERKEFEKFAASHPAVKEELGIFQQTKLQPEEEIVFTNKEILYRKEEPVRVITMQWWKIAVAAAVILAIGITTITVLNKPAAVDPGVATNNKTNTEKNNTATKTQDDLKKEQQSNPAEIKNNSDAVASTNSDNKKSTTTPVQKVNEERIQKKIIAPVLNKDNNESVAQNNIPVKSNNTVIDNKTNETKIIDAIKKSDEPVKTNDVAMNTKLPKEIINNDPVTKSSEVAYNIQTDANNTDGAVAASYDEGKNKKLRGFFRKAARVFERRTNISSSEEDNNDKVLIGALAVKLK